MRAHLRFAPLFVLCAALASPNLPAQVVWDFSGGTGAPSSLSANITGGTIAATNLAGGSLTFDSTSASSGYLGASGGNNASVRTVTSASLNTATSTYFSFTITPEAGYQIQATGLTLGSRSTSTGPTTLSLYSSVDSFAAPLATANVSGNSTWASVTLSSFVVAGATDAAVTFRLYGAPSGTSASANWRVDDLTLTASASAIPEPSTYAAIFGCAMLGAALWKRRTRPAGITTTTGA